MQARLNFLCCLMMVMILAIMALSLSRCAQAQALTPKQAFDQANAFGKGQLNNNLNNVNTGTANRVIPNYDNNPNTATQSQYFNQQGVNLNAQGDTALAACQLNPNTPSCQAMTFANKNPQTRPKMTIPKNSDMFTNSLTVTKNPDAIAGNIAGTYSACTTQNITHAATFTTEICNTNFDITTASCSKQLSVTVETKASCNAGEQLGIASGHNTCLEWAGADPWLVNYGVKAVCQGSSAANLVPLGFFQKFQIMEFTFGAQGCFGNTGHPPDAGTFPYTIVEVPDKIDAEYEVAQLTKLESTCLNQRNCSGKPDTPFKFLIQPGSGCTATDCHYTIYQGPVGQVCTPGTPNPNCAQGRGGLVCPPGQNQWLVPPVCTIGKACSNGFCGSTFNLTFKRAGYVPVVTDTWSNGCADLEARTVP